MTDYPPKGAIEPTRPLPVLARAAVTLAVGAVAGVMTAGFAPWHAVPLVAWDAIALTWVFFIAATINLAAGLVK
jgi:hypothetical protein